MTPAKEFYNDFCITYRHLFALHVKGYSTTFSEITESRRNHTVWLIPYELEIRFEAMNWKCKELPVLLSILYFFGLFTSMLESALPFPLTFLHFRESSVIFEFTSRMIKIDKIQGLWKRCLKVKAPTGSPCATSISAAFSEYCVMIEFKKKYKMFCNCSQKSPYSLPIVCSDHQALNYCNAVPPKIMILNCCDKRC